MAYFNDRFQAIRQMTVDLCAPLTPEDAVLQSMPDVSPPKWHLAHTTWFFETMVLEKFAPNFKPFHPNFSYLFNSYYESIGPRQPRPQRGFLSRPSLSEVLAYRAAIDGRMLELLATLEGEDLENAQALTELGLHHEQQHQELLVMDIKHIFFTNPLHPAYVPQHKTPVSTVAAPLQWIEFPEGVVSVGHSGSDFSYDNERPAHREFVASCKIASRLVTNSEYMEFMSDSGYDRPDLWLADGWATVQGQGWKAPNYWMREGGEWQVFTLNGVKKIDPHRPVGHVSYFEAQAFARWANKQLPTEAQWENAARSQPLQGHFLEDALRCANFEATAAPETRAPTLAQMYGDLWEWTQSAYLPYPGFSPEAGALGEYNGKFMSGQMVLRGGACITPKKHLRPSYRNFYYPHMRWQYAGIRLMENMK